MHFLLKLFNGLRGVTLGLGLLAGLAGAAQGQSLKKAMKQLDQGQLEPARVSLHKLKATPENMAGQAYLFSLLLFKKGPELINYDSSQTFLLEARQRYAQVPAAKLGNLANLGIDTLAMRLHQKRLDSLGFALAQHENTEASYQRFLSKRPQAYQARQATKLRNQVAFENARKANTYEAYRKFLDKYPDAEEAHNALDVYQVLLYESEAGSGKEADLAAFVRNYPANPYVTRAITQLYYIRTAVHRPQVYMDFARQYAGSNEGRQALAYVALMEPKMLDTHLVRRYGPNALPANWLRHPADTVYAVTDSVGRFHFMDGNGKVVLRSNLPRLPQHLQCKPVEWTRVMGLTAAIRQHLRWVSAAKQDTLKDQSEIAELGAFALRIGPTGKQGLWHRGGWQLLAPEFEEIAALEDRLLAARKGGKWGIFSMQGHELQSPQFDEVEMEDGMLLLTAQNHMALTSPAQLFRVLQKDSARLQFAYDDIVPAGGGQFMVRINRQWGVVDTAGRRLVPVRYDRIEAAGQAFLLHNPEGILVANRQGRLLSRTIYEKVQFNQRFIGVKADNKWGVLSPAGEVLQPTTYDSLRFFGKELLLATMQGRQYVGFGQNWRDFGNYANVTLVYNKPDSGEGRAAFLLATTGTGKQALFSASGRQVLPPVYDIIDFANGQTLIVTKAGKTGLVDTAGKPVLPLLYSGAGFVRGDYIAVVSNQKFGLFDMAKKKMLIQPKYESAPAYYGRRNDLVILRREGQLGLFNSSGRQIMPPAYDEIRYWADEIALVRQKDKWFYFDIPGMRRSQSGYTQVVLDEAYPRVLMQATSTEKRGVVYNMTGMLCPYEYDEVTNIGTLHRPLIMARRDVAGNQQEIHYYGMKGRLLRQVLLPRAVGERVCE